MSPHLSVVIVSYRTRELTLRCVRALAATAGGTPYEVIVVDNASPDGSAEALVTAGLPVRLVRLARNVGFGRAVNAGAAVARGRWLLLLNPDSLPEGDVVTAFAEAAAADPAAGIWAGRTLREDGTDDGRSCLAPPTLWSLLCYATGVSTVFRSVRWLNPEALPGLDRSRAGPVPAASGCLLLLDAERFRALGGFAPEYFMYSEDVDLCVRAVTAGARPVLVPAARARHIGGASSTTETKRVMVLRGKVTFLRRHWSPRRVRLGIRLLTAGVGLRAAGARLTGRAGYWRAVWAQRAVWRAGWPPPAESPPAEVVPPEDGAPADAAVSPADVVRPASTAR